MCADCTQANSTFYPQRDGKCVVAHLLWPMGWKPSVDECGQRCVC